MAAGAMELGANLLQRRTAIGADGANTNVSVGLLFGDFNTNFVHIYRVCISQLRPPAAGT